MHGFVLLASILIIPCTGFAARIVGGKDANIENYPYQLSMEYKGIQTCGAAIIGPTWVITAAHCVSGKEVSEVQFRAGSSIRQSGGSLHHSKKFYIHPNYVADPPQNDIAVVKVEEIFEYGQGVEPIQLATEEPKAGEVAVISGWGSTDKEGKIFPTQLQVVSIPIIDRQSCDYSYMKFGGIESDRICAGDVDGLKDACSDDSGGPLVIGGKLVGVVSFGNGCASPQYPGVYSNVAVLRDFVVSVTGTG